MKKNKKILFSLSIYIFIVLLVAFFGKKSSMTVYAEGIIKPTLESQSTPYGMNFGNISDPAQLVFLSNDEKKALLKGENVNLILSVKSAGGKAALAEDRDAIDLSVGESRISKEKPAIIDYFDIKIYTQIGTNSSKKTSIDTAAAPIPFTMEVPKQSPGIKSGCVRNYYFFGVHNGSVNMEGPFFENNGVISFGLQKFSVYGLTYVDLPPEVVAANDESPNYRTYYGSNTSASEIKEKIDSLTSKESKDNETEDLEGEISQMDTEDSFDDTAKDSSQEENKQVSYNSKIKNISLSENLVFLALFDLILVGGFIVFLMNLRK